MDAMVVSVLTAVGGGDVLCIKQVGEFGVAKVKQWQRKIPGPSPLSVSSCLLGTGSIDKSVAH